MNKYERLEIHERCLRDTKNDQLWEAHAEYQRRIGPTVQSYSRKSVRTKARVAFWRSSRPMTEYPTHESGELCRYCGEDATGTDALGRDACDEHIESVEDDLVGQGILERCERGCCLFNADGSVARYTPHVEVSA